MTTVETAPADVVRALFAAIDGGDLATIDTLVAERVHFRFGNADPTETKTDFASAAQAFLGSLAAIRHEIHELWEVDGGTVMTEMDVHYTRQDGGELILPCCNIFRVRDGLVVDYRIYMDVSPVFA